MVTINTRKWMRRLSAGMCGSLLLATAAQAEPVEPLQLYATGVAQNAARVMQLQFAEGTRKGWEYGPQFVQTGGTDKRVVSLVQEGAAADIIIVQTSEMEGLKAAGLVRPETVKPLGRVHIAVGVKPGAPRPDISTYEKFRDALLAAGAVTYSDPTSGSAGGMLIHSILDKPEFANLKREHRPGSDAPIMLQPVGQMRGNTGVDEVGLVPDSLNAYLEFSIAVGKNAKHPDAALAFQNYALQPQFASVWTQWGVAR